MEPHDLQETANLARLLLSEQELQSMLPAFNEMLALFATMEAAGSDVAMPDINSQADFVLAGTKPLCPGSLRPDTAVAQKDTVECMLSQAPERDGSFIVIPNVL
jgi:aspartyl/glutamyl-tRNA(Asn/Gln) amidotransferase C subunit